MSQISENETHKIKANHRLSGKDQMASDVRGVPSKLCEVCIL